MDPRTKLFSSVELLNQKAQKVEQWIHIRGRLLKPNNSSKVVDPMLKFETKRTGQLIFIHPRYFLEGKRYFILDILNYSQCSIRTIMIEHDSYSLISSTIEQNM